MRYASLGDIPAKRHVQFRENGALLVEEVLGFEGFSGNESILYHLWSPCRVKEVGEFEPIEREEWVPDTHVHRLTNTLDLEPFGDPVQGRQLLQYNADVEIAHLHPGGRGATTSTATARATRSSSSTRAAGCSRRSSARCRSASTTTS